MVGKAAALLPIQLSCFLTRAVEVPGDSPLPQGSVAPPCPELLGSTRSRTASGPGSDPVEVHTEGKDAERAGLAQ